MCLRISSAVLALALAGCGTADAPPATPEPTPTPVAERVVEGPVTETVECAAEGAAFVADCTLERAAGADGGSVLTIRHPDGAFRRLLLAADGTVRAADGAVPAVERPAGDGVRKIAVGDMRYRFATR